jgi:hypothetical protein
MDPMPASCTRCAISKGKYLKSESGAVPFIVKTKQNWRFEPLLQTKYPARNASGAIPKITLPAGAKKWLNPSSVFV